MSWLDAWLILESLSDENREAVLQLAADSGIDLDALTDDQE